MRLPEYRRIEFIVTRNDEQEVLTASIPDTDPEEKVIYILYRDFKSRDIFPLEVHSKDDYGQVLLAKIMLLHQESFINLAFTRGDSIREIVRWQAFEFEAEFQRAIYLWRRDRPHDNRESIQTMWRFDEAFGLLIKQQVTECYRERYQAKFWHLLMGHIALMQTVKETFEDRK